MPRDITVTFDDGSSHVYKGAPEDATPDQVSERAAREFGRAVTALDGGRKAAKPTFGQMFKAEMLTSLPGGVARGMKDVVDTGAQYLSRIGGDEARVKAMNDAGKAEFKAAQGLAGAGGSDIARVLGNIAGVAPITAAAGAGLSAAGASNLGRAVATGGMTGGGLLSRTAGGALSGGIGAGLVDPESAGAGALIGAAAPGVLKTAGALGGKTADLVRYGMSAFSDDAARSIALNKARQAVGKGNITQAVGDIQTYYPKGAENIPVSAAGITRSPALAQLEQGSRLRNTPAWHEFDQRTNKAVFENVQRATREADELGARFDAKDANWAANWAKAEEAVKPRVFAREMGSLYGDLKKAMLSKESVNPSVRGAVQEVYDTVQFYGNDFSPGHLQALRAQFNGKVQHGATGIKAAPREDPLVRSMIAEMDDILNKTTGGKWSKVMQGYAKDSTAVRQAQGAEKVRDTFTNAQTGIAHKAGTDDVPRITSHWLDTAIHRAKDPRGDVALSDLAIDNLSATLDAIRRGDFVREVKGAATAKGDSGTASNLIAAASRQSPLSNAVPIAGPLFRHARDKGAARVDVALAELLQNPDELAKLLPQLERAGIPLSGLLAPTVYRGAPMLATGQ